MSLSSFLMGSAVIKGGESSHCRPPHAISVRFLSIFTFHVYKLMCICIYTFFLPQHIVYILLFSSNNISQRSFHLHTYRSASSFVRTALFSTPRLYQYLISLLLMDRLFSKPCAVNNFVQLLLAHMSILVERIS